MSKFKVGDIVTIVDRKHGHRFCMGDEVKIVDVRPENYRAQSIRTGEFWTIEDVEVKPKNLPTTIIYHKNRETIAMFKEGNKVIKAAKAVYNPADEKEGLPFSEEYGRALALARLNDDQKMIDFLLRGEEKFIPTHSKIVKQDKYQVGDKVKIIEKWVTGCYQNSNGEMDKWLGKIMTIARADMYLDYRMKEDHGEGFGNGWKWNNQCIEGKVIEEPVPSGTSATEQQPFDWEDFKVGKFAVHCDTEEKANQFFDEMKMNGIKWCDERELTDTRWNINKERTHYGFFNATHKGICFGQFNTTPHIKIDYTPNYHEVQRPAKVGEWIKVVNASYMSGCYKNGDILLVTRIHKNGIYVNTQTTHRAKTCRANESFLWGSEYVVLEPITHTIEEPKSIDLSTVSTEAIFEELRKRVK